MTTLLGMFKLASLWSSLSGFVSGLFGRFITWFRDDPKSALLAVMLIVVLAMGWRANHLKADRDAALARAKDSDAARAISDASVKGLQGQITNQNLAMMALRKASDDAQAAGAKAAAAAQVVADQRNAAAGRIVMPPRRAPVADCRTPDAVMKAQGGV